eukprot:m.650587 g.650587  ORF g.650587 m.650587 type:complete len:128 (-) comp58395_c0_seq35:515-898(-)
MMTAKPTLSSRVFCVLPTGLLEGVKRELHWLDLPLFALGASSGSSMIGRLIAHPATKLFKAVALFVPDFSNIVQYMAPSKLVPTIVVQMPNDPFTRERVDEPFFELMRANGNNNIHQKLLFLPISQC